MRHDTTNTPTRAPASITASSPRAKINALEGGLHCLYAQRAGQLERGQESGWYTARGHNIVFPLDGEDSRRACIANRTGRQP